MEQAARLIANPRPDREPAPSRRSLLSFFASTAAVATTAAIPSVAIASPVAQEAPELLALGRRLDALARSRDAAVAKLDAAREVFERLKPSLPPELIAPVDETPQLTVVLRDWYSRQVARQDGQPVHIYDHYSLYAWKRNRGIDGRTKEGRRIERLRKISEQHYAAMHEAGVAADIDAADRAVHGFVALFRDIVEEIVGIEPRTTAGMLVYARALLEANRANLANWHWKLVERLGSALSEAVIRTQANQTA